MGKNNLRVEEMGLKIQGKETYRFHNFRSYKLKQTGFKSFAIGFNWLVIPSGFLWNNKICNLVQQFDGNEHFMFNCQIRGG